MSGLILSWPPAALSPNGRTHWAKKAKAAKTYRTEAWALAKAAKLIAPDGPLGLAIEFYPPDARRRDLDNMLASVKHAIDGIAEAIGVDDSRFSYTITRRDPIKGGRVSIVVMA